MHPTKERLKQLRAIGHNLKPVVIVTQEPGDSVHAEIDRALNDHELIKIKFAVSDRTEKKMLVGQVCDSHQAALVQMVGNIALILRDAKNPNPRLSNLQRHKSG